MDNQPSSPEPARPDLVVVLQREPKGGVLREPGGDVALGPGPEQSQCDLIADPDAAAGEQCDLPGRGGGAV